MRARRRLFRIPSGVRYLMTGALGVAVAAAALVTTTAAPAAAYPTGTVDLVGHGFGHGRGLSQYGSLGYALGGSSWQDILNHYYSNTAMAGVGNVGIGV